MATGPGKEVGASGLNISSGGVVLEELHPNLNGRKALETYRAMGDNDALIGAILYAFDMLCRQVEWSVEQKNAKEEHKEFLEGCMDDMSMSWGDVISEIFSMLKFGFAPLEIVYKKCQGPQPPGSKVPSSRFNDGKVRWRKLPLRAQETLDHWEFDDEGGIVAMVQNAPPAYKQVEIPVEKLLLFRTTSHKNNPEGRSILRNAYTSWFYKRHFMAIEGTGIERDLAGFPTFWIPSEFLADDATPEQKAVKAAFETIGKNIRRDKQEFLMMPLAYDENGNKAFDFSLTASAGTRTFDLNQVIGRYNQEIAMSVLADFILLGHEKVGSFALSSDKTDLFAVALGTILDTVADVFNRYAIPRLFALNGFPLDNLPEIAHGDIEQPDLAKIGAFLQALNAAGMPLFPDDDLDAWLRQIAGMPERSEEAKAAQEAAEQEEPDGPTGGSGGSGAAGGSGDDAFDALVRSAENGAGAGTGGQGGPAGSAGSNGSRGATGAATGG